MTDECSPNLLSPTLKKIHAYLAYLEKLVIKVSSSVDSNDKSKLENIIKHQHVKKSEFNKKVTEFLKCNDVTSIEISSMLSAPRTLRSQISLSISITSGMKMAAAKAEEQVALLKVTHLEKQLDLERQKAQIKFKRDLEEHELKRKREMLKAKQKLEEASLQRQVLEEKTDREGYLPLEPISSSAEKASPLDADVTKSLPSKSFIQTSQFQTSFEDNYETSPLLNTEQISVDAFRSTLPKSEYPVLFPGATSQAHSSQGNATTSIVQTLGVSVQNFHSPLPKKLFSDKVKKYDSSAFDTRNTVSSATHLPGMNATRNDSVLPQTRVQFNEMTNVSQAPTNNVREQINDKQRRSATPTAQIAIDPVSFDNNQMLFLASALQLPRDFPQLEVIKFDGDPRKYTKFIRTYAPLNKLWALLI